MRSVAFFLIVFSALLLTLWLVVERDPAPRKNHDAPDPSAAETQPGVGAVGAIDAVDRNDVDMEFFDVDRGRLLYRFRGQLPAGVFQIDSVSTLERFVLHDGQLEIPIYADMAQGLPELQKIVLSFAQAEYTRVDQSVVRREEKIHLTGGGHGIANDGSRIRFEELDIVIRQAATAETTIRSDKPVSFANNLIDMRSSKGFEGTIKSGSNLERLTFLPPVETYIDPASADLLSLGGSASRPAAELGAAGRIAITSAGPLVLDRTSSPTTVEFRDDIRVFPVDAPPAEGAPIPAPDEGPLGSWFHCQKLTLLIDEDSGASPRLSEAIATWDGERVVAHHEGLRIDGDALRWKNLAEPDAKDASSASAAGSLARAPSIARLTGRPRVRGEEIDLEADEISFALAERKIGLMGDVDGELRFLRPAPDAGKDPAKDGEGKPGGERAKRDEPAATPPPERWSFTADTVDVVLFPAAAAGAADATGAAPRGAKRGDRDGRRHASGLADVESLHASSSAPGGLVFSSLASEEPGEPSRPPSRLEGRELHYDGVAKVARVTDGPERLPRFAHGKSDGEAESVALDLAANVLRLESRVRARLDREDLQAVERALREKEESADGGGSGGGAEKTAADGAARAATTVGPEAPPAIADAAADAGASSARERLLQGVDVSGDSVEIRFDENRAIVSALAVSRGVSPVVLESRPPAKEGAAAAPAAATPSGYRIVAPSLAWNHVDQIALVEASDTAPEAFRVPRLEFPTGVLSARRLEFERASWLAKLAGDIKLLDPATAAGDAAAGSSAFELRADEADVEFYELFEEKAPGESRCFSELRSVRRFEARATPPAAAGAPARAITLRSTTFGADAQRVAWDAETQALRLFGDGVQKFHRYEDGRTSTIVAEEVTYRRADGVVALERGVAGEFLLRGASARRAETAPAPGPPSSAAPEALLWRYSSDALDVRVRESDDCKSLELVSLAAREKVVLACDAEGVTLHGDDLEMIEERRELRVFSRAGRYQTLTQRASVKKGAPPAQAPLNKIDAREILVWYTSDPSAPGAARRNHVVARFTEDVTATFYAPEGFRASVLPGAAPADPGQLEEWKLRADQVLLRLLAGPDEDVRVQQVVAGGEVIVTSENMKGIAREAIYEEDKRQLTLRGDERNRVQISIDGKPFSGEVITLTQQGSKFQLKTR